jgi:hypothetical protein
MRAVRERAAQHQSGTTFPKYAIVLADAVIVLMAFA